MESCPVDLVDLCGGPAIKSVESFFQLWASRYLPEMCGVFAGDIGMSNSKSDLAGWDHANLFWRVGVVGEGGGDVGVGSDVVT